MGKSVKIFKKHTDNTESPNNSVRVGSFRSSFSAPKKPVLILAIVLAVVLVVGIIMIATPHKSSTGVKLSSENDFMNDAIQKHNNTLALEHAKKALVKNPHDVEAILAVANIDKKVNPTEAKQYFKQALNEFRLQDNPDIHGKLAVTYWAAAQMAEESGDTSSAVKYYKEVISAGKSADSYSQSLATQSEAALKRLQ